MSHVSRDPGSTASAAEFAALSGLSRSRSGLRNCAPRQARRRLTFGAVVCPTFILRHLTVSYSNLCQHQFRARGRRSTSALSPFQPRRLSAFVSAIGGLAADRLCCRRVVDDPNVWSGRASQEVFVELVVSGLASMYPAPRRDLFSLSHTSGHGSILLGTRRSPILVLSRCTLFLDGLAPRYQFPDRKSVV